MSWSLQNKNKGIFCTVYFVRRKFFCGFYVNVYCIECTFSICILLPHTLLLLVSKIVESLQCTLKKIEDKLKCVSFPEDTKFECVKVTYSHFVDISMKVNPIGQKTPARHLVEMFSRCLKDSFFANLNSM